MYIVNAFSGFEFQQGLYLLLQKLPFLIADEAFSDHREGLHLGLRTGQQGLADLGLRGRGWDTDRNQTW